jgi:anti-sigma-K factor RskA
METSDRAVQASSSTATTSAGLSQVAKQLAERRDSEFVVLLQILETRNAELQREVGQLRETLQQDREERIERLKDELIERVTAIDEGDRVRELEVQNSKLREQLDRERREEITRLRAEVQRLTEERGSLKTQVEQLRTEVQEPRAAERAAGVHAGTDAGRRMDLTPAYVAEVFVEIDRRLGEADRCELLGRKDEAANILFVVGHKACEALWKLCDDAGFYERLTALGQLSVSDRQKAEALISDDGKFEEFLEKLLQLLQVAGMEQARARDLITQCRVDFNNRQDHTPLRPPVFRAHLRRLRNATCEVAKGELVRKVKRRKRQKQFKSIAVATGASGLKIVATTAGSTLGPGGAAASSLLADAAVAAASTAFGVDR